MSETICIRMATEADAPALLAIYAPYVTDTGITFEYEVPSVEEFSGRIKRILSRYPYLVAEEGGRLLGYAYAASFKERAAYDWSVETTIYMDQRLRGRGIGQKLYLALEGLLRRQHILNANACIAYPNPGSIQFHERMGYQTVAHFTRCGYKLGVWYDMVWMEKLLSVHPAEPEPVLAIDRLSVEPILCKAEPCAPFLDHPLP